MLSTVWKIPRQKISQSRNEYKAKSLEYWMEDSKVFFIEVEKEKPTCDKGR